MIYLLGICLSSALDLKWLYIYLFQVVHHRLEKLSQHKSDLTQQLEKVKEENEDLKFQVFLILLITVFNSIICRSYKLLRKWLKRIWAADVGKPYTISHCQQMTRSKASIIHSKIENWI